MDLRRLIHRALVDILKRRGIALDGISFDGLIKVREMPFNHHDEIARWWLSGRMSEREKERYTVCEARNLMTIAGKTALLTYLSNQYPKSPAWAQQFGVGSFPISSVSPGDTSVQGEFYRNNPSAVIVSNNAQGVPTTLDLTTIFNGTNGNGRWFSAGLFGGGNATSSTGTGQLNTHALISPSYVKATGTISIDYTITLN